MSNAAEVPTPCLLVYGDRMRWNIERMVRLAGGPDRLRPHIKTHKLPEVLKFHLDAGVTKFKCATVAEAEIAAQAGASEVLLAYQPTGPNPLRLRMLSDLHPRTQFGAVVDDAGPVRALSNAFAGALRPLELFLDTDCGMHRTGIEPGAGALELYRFMRSLKGVCAAGLHVYDGHIQDADVAVRRARCVEAFEPIREFREELEKAGLPVRTVIAGGTPTFPIHALDASVECSPGTCVLWDFGYGDKFQDMPFLYGALVMTRVVSKPASNRLCLDLGHKAIASENPHPRVRLMGLEEAVPVMHSEEHLVIETPLASNYRIGDVVYGVPRHICPTVALYSEAYAVENGVATGRWLVTARARVISV